MCVCVCVCVCVCGRKRGGERFCFVGITQYDHPYLQEKSGEVSRKNTSGNKAGKTQQKAVKAKREAGVQHQKGKSKKDVVDDCNSSSSGHLHTETASHPEPREERREEAKEAVPPPPAGVPLRVLPVGQPAIPPTGCRLWPHPGGTGVVVCDPSTGVPLVGSVPGGAQVLPIPPCIHMPTAIPLRHTPASPSPTPAPPPTATALFSTAESEAHRPDTTARPSVADVGLQTSFSETSTNKPPQLIQEVSVTCTL